MRESGLWIRETLALRASVSIERNLPHFAGANNLATDGSADAPGLMSCFQRNRSLRDPVSAWCTASTITAPTAAPLKLAVSSGR